MPWLPDTNSKAKGRAMQYPWRLCVACALLLLSGPTQQAEEESATKEEHGGVHERLALYRRSFENRWDPRIGTWVNERIGDDGSSLREVHHYRWILDHQFVACDVTITVDGAVAVEQQVMIGLDELAQQDRFWCFDSNGCHWHSVDCLGDEGSRLWIIKYVGLCRNQRNSWTEVIELEGDTYNVTKRDCTLAGRFLLEDEGPIEFKREE